MKGSDGNHYEDTRGFEDSGKNGGVLWLAKYLALKQGRVFHINPATAAQPTVFGGIPVSPSKDTWNGNIMLIRPGVLRETNNELHIESRNSSGGSGGDIDDFIIDNVVVLYKTR